MAGVTQAKRARPLSVIIAASGAALVGLLLIVMAAASLAAGHGAFSGGVGLALIIYGAAMVAAGWALWRLQLLGRGPVGGLSLLNLVAGYTFTGSCLLYTSRCV